MRTGLTIIMMMFFAGLALDITLPTVLLAGAVVLDWAGMRLRRGFMLPEERA